MSIVRRFAVVCAIAALLQGCSSPSGGISDLGLSGGVPITGRALASTGAGTTMEITVTWPVAPASATATFRYYVLDYSSAAAPAWTSQSNALAPISGDSDGDWDVDVPVTSATTKHSVTMQSVLGKTYRVVVLVTMTNAGTEYTAACWFEVKP
jgi:hypothetical protein